MARASRSIRIALAAPALLGAALAQALGLPPNCLEVLRQDTRRWSECTAEFDREDSRCKTLTGRMHATMERCEAKGYSKRRIDAAMTSGYRSAGDGGAAIAPPDRDEAPAPAVRGRRGPIPGVEKVPAADD